MTESLTMSVAETASTLGISERLVYALIDRGDLPAIAFGRRKVVPAKAVDLLLEHALEGFDPSSLARKLGVAAGSASAAEPRLDVPTPTGGTVAAEASAVRGADPTGTTGTDTAEVIRGSRTAPAVARSRAPVASSSSP